MIKSAENEDATKPLQEALDAVTDGQYREALRPLLRAWRIQPSEPLANAVAAVSARSTLGYLPPTGKTAAKRNAAWLSAAVEGDPTQVAILVETLLETRGSRQTMERLEALLVHGPDPRLSAKVASILESPPYNASVSRTTSFWKRLFEMLPELGDPLLLGLGERLPPTWAADQTLSERERETLQRRLRKAAPKLEARFPGGAPKPSPKAVRICTAIVKGLGEPLRSAVQDQRTQTDLLADVYTRPWDDAPRLVYADWLLERGDPRGEFITLQFQAMEGALPRAQAGRMKDLLAEFGDLWLGELAPLVQKKGRVFQRGFLHKCRAHGIDDNPAWSTVCSIQAALPQSDSTRLSSLRTFLDIHTIKPLAELTKALAVEELQWNGPYRDWQSWREWGAKEIELFRQIRVLPALRKLWMLGADSWIGLKNQHGVTPDQLEWLWESAAGQNLEELILPGRFDTLVDWYAHMGKPSNSIGMVTLSSKGGALWNAGWQATLSIDQSEHISLQVSAPPALRRRDVSPDQLAAVTVQANLIAAGLDGLPEHTVAQVCIDSGADRALHGKPRLAIERAARNQHGLEALLVAPVTRTKA